MGTLTFADRFKSYREQEWHQRHNTLMQQQQELLAAISQRLEALEEAHK